MKSGLCGSCRELNFVNAIGHASKQGLDKLIASALFCTLIVHKDIIFKEIMILKLRGLNCSVLDATTSPFLYAVLLSIRICPYFIRKSEGKYGLRKCPGIIQKIGYGRYGRTIEVTCVNFQRL